MAYEKQNFANGNVLTAEQLNHIEDGIEANSNFQSDLFNAVSIDYTITTQKESGNAVEYEVNADGSVTATMDKGTGSSLAGVGFYFTVPTVAENVRIAFDVELLEGTMPSKIYEFGSFKSLYTYTQIADNHYKVEVPVSVLGTGARKVCLCTDSSATIIMKNIVIESYDSLCKSAKAVMDEIKKPIGTGKKAMFLGDSITQLGTTNRGWVKYFLEKTGCELVVNVAVVGARLQDKDGTVYDGNPVFEAGGDNLNNVLGNQVQKILNNSYDAPDIIMIAIGTNNGILKDSKALTSADMKAVYYNSDGSLIPLENVDRTTSAGAYRWCLEKLHEKYPNAIIFWCTPILGHEARINSWFIVTTGESLRVATEYTGQMLIDTIRCGINGTEEPFYPENEGESRWSEGRYFVDGLHPNANGAKKIGYYNASKVIPFLGNTFELEQQEEV